MKITNGRVRRRVWFHDGKRRESWGWSVEVDGKQVRRQGWDSRAEAQDELHRFKEELRNPKPVEAKPEARPEMTLAQAFERYFKAKARKRSLADDERLSKHLLDALGKDTPLSALTAARIAEYQEQRLATKSRQTGGFLSPASVNRPLQLVRHLLQLAARRWEVIPRVPEIDLVKEKPRERFLTQKEARRLLTACRESRNPDLLDVVELALFTGLRRGDVIGLTWESVDRARGMLIVHREKDDKPLNVPLNAKSDAVLARRRPEGSAEPTGYVFRSQSWDTYRTAWEAATRRAKLHDVHFHDLRHTCASWLAQAGRTMREIQDFLGHRTIAMAGRYSHLAPSHLRAAAAVLDTALDEVPANQPTSQSTTGAQIPEESPTAP